MKLRFARPVVIAACALVAAITFIAGCSGGSHSTVPLTTTGGQSASAIKVTGSLGIQVQLPSGVQFASSSARKAQYVSGSTMGVYITGTCVATAFDNNSCTGAAFPATYADVSSGSPLCTPGPPRTCTISANPVPGYAYSIVTAVLDQKPTGAVNGYGTGFNTAVSGGAHMLAVGTIPAPAPASNVVPAPSPTPSCPPAGNGNGACPYNIGKGNANMVNMSLNAIATQFVRIDPITQAANGHSGLSAASGTLGGPSYFFAAGDAAGNLISSATCFNPSYTVTATGIVSSSGATGCDNFAGPDGKVYAVSVTSTLPTHLCYFPNNAAPGTTCTTTGTTAAGYTQSDFSSVFEEGGNWYQEPPGVLSQFPEWDGTAASDSCSGTTPKCGVPLPLTVSNGVPATVVPLVGTTSAAAYQAVVQNGATTGSTQSTLYLAPMVTAASCGTNAACSVVNNCTAPQNCPQVVLDDNGTATVTVYAYASGGSANLAAGTGCYAGTVAGTPLQITAATESTACMGVATSNANTPVNPVNLSSCYNEFNTNTGVQNTGGNPVGPLVAGNACYVVPDSATGNSLGTNGLPPGSGTQPGPNGSYDCLQEIPVPGAVFGAGVVPSGAPVAFITPGKFTRGTLASGTTNLGTADSMTFTIQGIPTASGGAASAGFCAFQIWMTTITTQFPNPNQTGPYTVQPIAALLGAPYLGPLHYAVSVSLEVSSPSFNVTIPPGQPFP